MRVLSLFDYTGNMVRPWALGGHECLIVDMQHEPGASVGIERLDLDLSRPDASQRLAAWRPDVIFSFPPCTDLAVSGARWFEAKRAADPLFQEKAASLARSAERISAMAGGVPWFAENPVSRLSTLWRKPDFVFDPFEFGGYLPADDRHPDYPDLLPPRDAYTKRTCLWTGGGFRLPSKRPVPLMQKRGSPLWRGVGGKSLRTKNIRSATPRGFAVAVYQLQTGAQS